MTYNIQETDRINEKYAVLARKHGLNPVWLRAILDLRNRGFKHSEINRHTGISRETIANYLKKLGSMEKKDYWLLVVGAGSIIAGVGLAAYFLDRKEASTSESDSTGKPTIST